VFVIFMFHLLALVQPGRVLARLGVKSVVASLADWLLILYVVTQHGLAVLLLRWRRHV
jgi:hypothetical protein